MSSTLGSSTSLSHPVIPSLQVQYSYIYTNRTGNRGNSLLPCFSLSLGVPHPSIS